MKSDSPKEVIIVYKSGTKLHVNVDVISEEWKQIVPLLFKKEAGRWELNLIERIKIKLLSIFTL